MKKNLFIALISVVFLISCDGLLWNGIDSSSGDELTISISNPDYSSSGTDNSKSLALQGKYLYIELARIDDIAAYNADTKKAVTGDGVWTETAWGAHAILTFSLANTNTLVATFKDVPRDQDIRVRAFIDTDESTVTDGLGMGLYGIDGDPICSTYDALAQDIFEPIEGNPNTADKWWQSITSSQLKSGLINLPLLPMMINSLSAPAWGTNLYMTDDYISTAQTKPTLGETSFSYINPDISSLKVKDIAFYSLVEGAIYDLSIIPSISILYDSDGTAFPIGSPEYTIMEPPFGYRILQVHSTTLPDYFSPDYILGSTLLSDPGIDAETWNLHFGVLFDNSIDLDIPSVGQISWDYPNGINSTDLEFRIIKTSSTSLTNAEIDTVEEILSLGKAVDTGWISGNSYDSLGSITDDGLGGWVIILAKHSGTTFIFGQYEIGMV